MKITGHTVDGRNVIGQLFAMHDTHGTPLSVSLMICEASNCVPDLYGFVSDAWVAGWNAKTIVSRIREAVVDNYPERWPQISSRLSLLLGGLE